MVKDSISPEPSSGEVSTSPTAVWKAQVTAGLTGLVGGAVRGAGLTSKESCKRNNFGIHQIFQVFIGWHEP